MDFEGNVQSLLEMGIARDVAEQALRECNGDVEAALNYIFNTPNEIDNDAMAGQQMGSVPVGTQGILMIQRLRFRRITHHNHSHTANNNWCKKTCLITHFGRTLIQTRTPTRVRPWSSLNTRQLMISYHNSLKTQWTTLQW